MLAWQLGTVPFLIALNAFFVATEYAVVALRSSQIETMRKAGHRLAADAMLRLRADMPSAIGAIQVCITMTNLLLGWIAEPAMTAVLMWALAPVGIMLPAGVWVVIATAVGFIIVTLLTVVFSELLPKALTLQHTQRVAQFTAVPMIQLQRLITPLVWVMNGLANIATRALGLGRVKIEGAVPTADEIAVIAAEAGEAGLLTTRERSLILNALSLGRRTARQIMVPRIRVVYLDVRRSMRENLETMGGYLYTRLPLCDGGMDNVLGVVHTKEFLVAFQEQADDSSVLRLIARPAVFAPHGVRLDSLLLLFKERRSHMIFLVDEYGGVEGIVTLTDVVDELIGEMRE